MSKTKPVILLDQDCVLSDFVGGLARVWGTTRQHLESLQPIGQYNYSTALSKLLERPVSEKEFWTSIESKVGFWADLEEFPWTRVLIDHVRSITDKWYIVTSPSRCPRCIPEKREWLHRVLETDWYDHLIPTPHKELMAKPGVVLIDDYDRNCKAFWDNGGWAISFPAHHNSMHHASADPMMFVEAALDSYLRNM